MEPDVDEVISRISQYTGRRAISRWRALAETCPSLALLAYERALQEIIRSTWDITQYKVVLNAYNKHAAANNAPPLSSDEPWLQDTQADISRTFNKLEMELKNYTSSLIKESIRISHQDLAAHHRKTGDTNNALRSLTKAREYCTSSTQVADLSFAILDLAMDSHNHKLAESYIGKAEGALDAATSKDNKQDAASRAKIPGTPGISSSESKEKDRARSIERLNVAKGLSYLGQGCYAKAASVFLKVSREAGQYPDMDALITPTDLAIYTALCALATFTRQELKERVIENTELRALLENEPRLKRILILFWENKHKEVLKFLDDWHPTYRVDIYLSNHIHTIIKLIQDRAILQYFSPFSSVSIFKAAEAFGCSPDKLLERVTESISQNTLHAKIDLPNGLILAHENELRADLFRNAIESAEQIEHESKAALLRLMLIHADVVVKDVQIPDISRGGKSTMPSGMK
ncbi:26S proteasome subunit RPN7-domain-containing protein [Melampsora americana]|nr:26S proteasome subunit RPN7-domain-containing protein [Melampsora americana]